MRSPRSAALALLAAITITSTNAALSGTSPFFLLSTEKSQQLPSQQLITASHLEDNLISALSKCDSTTYFFVSYPGLDTSIVRRNNAMPKLQKRLKSTDYESVVQIPEVLGETDIARVAHSVSQNCRIEEYNLPDGKPGSKKKAIFGPTTLPSLTTFDPAKRLEALQSEDYMFDTHIRNLVANHTSHTIVLVGVPSSEKETYHWEQENEPPFESGMHTDLKRDVETGFKKRQQKSTNPQDGLPLFEKYQFLSPGKQISYMNKPAHLLNKFTH